ncbi:hypothetical protein MHA_0636 [Mannheimia haemolytica PHL213]|nr:hypothetical protein MHA_0636 [Mannheimia haemolytica PHL213]
MAKFFNLHTTSKQKADHQICFILLYFLLFAFD